MFDVGAFTSGLLTGLREGVEAALIVAIVCAIRARRADSSRRLRARAQANENSQTRPTRATRESMVRRGVTVCLRDSGSPSRWRDCGACPSTRAATSQQTR